VPGDRLPVLRVAGELPEGLQAIAIRWHSTASRVRPIMREVPLACDFRNDTGKLEMEFLGNNVVRSRFEGTFGVDHATKDQKP